MVDAVETDHVSTGSTSKRRRKKRTRSRPQDSAIITNEDTPPTNSLERRALDSPPGASTTNFEANCDVILATSSKQQLTHGQSIQQAVQTRLIPNSRRTSMRSVRTALTCFTGSLRLHPSSIYLPGDLASFIEGPRTMEGDTLPTDTTNYHTDAFEGAAQHTDGASTRTSITRFTGSLCLNSDSYYLHEFTRSNLALVQQPLVGSRLYSEGIISEESLEGEKWLDPCHRCSSCPCSCVDIGSLPSGENFSTLARFGTQ
ncbi:hypothetical protein JAAARDRAFT_637543 [Jaapia argillacea MUCL 33604]|uniref:Uncharacterized protein n=1 Tax=Jaapia argillacea MUCL 33604 TaxID=933084 RepID=A0A067QBK4_9AGAM|nr:hypothetical protein JAAARDRAFT_637543 [Jaapia argillacea MUCL 33604]